MRILNNMSNQELSELVLFPFKVELVNTKVGETPFYVFSDDGEQLYGLFSKSDIIRVTFDLCKSKNKSVTVKKSDNGFWELI